MPKARYCQCGHMRSAHHNDGAGWCARCGPGKCARFVDKEVPEVLPQPLGKLVRVVRTLEYIGPEKWIDITMAKNAITAEGRTFGLGFTIKEISRETSEAI